MTCLTSNDASEETPTPGENKQTTDETDADRCQIPTLLKTRCSKQYFTSCNMDNKNIQRYMYYLNETTKTTLLILSMKNKVVERLKNSRLENIRFKTFCTFTTCEASR